MLRFLSAVAISFILSVSVLAQWQPLYDIQHNTPSYGTARDIAVVRWNNLPYVFAADYNTGVCHSEDEGETWIWSQNPSYYSSKATLVVPNPYIAGVVYIARDEAGQEGFWYSDNYGSSFSPRNGNLPNTALGSILSIYVDPNAPHPVYITCKFTPPNDQGRRIFKTTDEGQSWTQEFGDAPFYTGSCPNLGRSFNITSMYIEPGSQNKIWIGNSHGNGEEFCEKTGVWYSSDAGTSWVQVLGGDYYMRYCYGENSHYVGGCAKLIQNPNFPADPNNPYCYAYTLSCTQPRASNQDISLWQATNDPIPYFMLIWELQGYALSSYWTYFSEFDVLKTPAPGNELYSILALTRTWSSDSQHGLFTLEPGILSLQIALGDPYYMTSINSGIYFPAANALATDPDNSLALFCGTISTNPSGGPDPVSYGGVYKTEDFGQNWVEVTKGMHTAASLDLDHSSTTLWAGGYQPDQQERRNILTVVNSEGCWTNRFDRGWFSSFRDFAVSNNGANIVVAVGDHNIGEDSLYFSDDFGQSFRSEFGYVEGGQAGHFRNVVSIGDAFFATIDIGPMILKRNPLTLWSTFNNGWPTVTGGVTSIKASSGSNMIYAGSQSAGMFKSSVSECAWQYVGLNGGGFNIDNISSIEVYSRSSVDSILAAGSISGQPQMLRVLKSKDGGSTWSYSDNGIEGYSIKAMASHPRKRQVVVATAQNENIPLVFLTISGGDYWANFSQGFDGVSVQEVKDITFKTSAVMAGNEIFVGTNFGIFKRNLVIVENDITSDTTWTNDDPIFLVGDLTVETGATLTIEPGTKIYFSPKYDETASGQSSNLCELIVRGSLVAQGLGTANNQIIFRPWMPDSLAGDDEWQGVRCLSGGSLNLRYCTIKNAVIGVYSESPEAIAIDRCQIENCDQAGIHVYEALGETCVSGTKIQDCGQYGIFSDKSYVFIALSDTIYGCEYGVYCNGSSIADIEDCEINGEPTGSYYGAYIIGDGTQALIKHTKISNFGQGGAYISGASEGSEILDVDFASGGVYGIFIDASYAPVPVNVESEEANFLRSNVYGLWVDCKGSAVVRRTKFTDNAVFDVFIADGGDADLGRDDANQHGENAFYMTEEAVLVVNENGSIVEAQWNYWELGPGEECWDYVYDANCDNALEEDPLPEPSARRDAPGHMPLMAGDFELAEAYPNPFNPSTTIKFSLTSPKTVGVDIYNLLGQKVKNLYSGQAQSGTTSLVWDGTNQSGEKVSAGMYLVQLRAPESRKLIKVTILK